MSSWLRCLLFSFFCAAAIHDRTPLSRATALLVGEIVKQFRGLAERARRRAVPPLSVVPPVPARKGPGEALAEVEVAVLDLGIAVMCQRRFKRFQRLGMATLFGDCLRQSTRAQPASSGWARRFAPIEPVAKEESSARVVSRLSEAPFQAARELHWLCDDAGWARVLLAQAVAERVAMPRLKTLELRWHITAMPKFKNSTSTSAALRPGLTCRHWRNRPIARDARAATRSRGREIASRSLRRSKAVARLKGVAVVDRRRQKKLNQEAPAMNSFAKIRHLAWLYEATGKPEKAKEWRTKLPTRPIIGSGLH